MMLRDYLTKEMSSCSSSDFQSFPRRRCCSSVMRVIQSEISKNKHSLPSFPAGGRKHSGALQKATKAVAKALKAISVPSQKGIVSAPQPKPEKPSTLPLMPRCLSRKMLRRRPPRRKPVECGGEVIQLGTYFQRDPLTPSDTKLLLLKAAPSCATSASQPSAGTVSESVDESKESVSEAIDKEADQPQLPKVEHHLMASEAPEIATNEGWTKERSSPVSVLECVFEDEEESASSLNFAGAKKDPTATFKRYESLSHVEPVNLLERYATTETSVLSDDAEDWSSMKREVLEVAERAAPGLQLEKLVSDLLEILRGREKMGYERVLASVGDWLSGMADDVVLGWHLERGRRAYMRDMEGDDWKRIREEEKDVALQIEDEAFHSLLEEALQILS